MPIASWVTFRGLLRVYSLGIIVPPSSDAGEYISRVKNLFGPRIFLALGLIVLGATLIYIYYFRSRTPGEGVGSIGIKTVKIGRLGASSAAILLSITSMAVTAKTLAGFERSLRPFEPELAALETFPTPPEWRSSNVSSDLANYPAATRVWGVSQPGPDVCRSLETALRKWVDSGSLVPTPAGATVSCSFRASKGPDRVVAIVYALENVNVTLTRKEKVDPYNVFSLQALGGSRKTKGI